MWYTILSVLKKNVIPRPIGPWESPGTMFVTAQRIDELYQEIATSPFYNGSSQ